MNTSGIDAISWHAREQTRSGMLTDETASKTPYLERAAAMSRIHDALSTRRRDIRGRRLSDAGVLALQRIGAEVDVEGQRGDARRYGGVFKCGCAL